MLRPIFVACALIASATCAARPMVIHQSQTLEPPPGSGYYFFGYVVAIDGDWAIVTAGTSSPTPVESAADVRRPAVSPRERAMDTRSRRWCVGCRRNGNTCPLGGDEQWRGRDRLQPDAHLQAHEQHLDGDRTPVHGAAGRSGLRQRRISSGTATRCSRNGPLRLSPQRPWGALISRLNVDGSWSPLERLSSGDTYCSRAVPLGHLGQHRGRGHLHQ